MNRADRERLVAHVETVIKLWQRCVDAAKGDSWEFRGERQAYHDCMESAKQSGLITGYKINPPRIWFPRREEPLTFK